VVLAGRRANREGVITITAREHRSQERNRREAVARLVALMREAARPPKPRKPTRPTESSRLRRVETKRRHGELKRGRSRKLDFI
jgi:ribosome-associated protein